MKEYRIGYTTGVFDLFHIGHLNILKNAKEKCEYLIVGVTTDEMVSYKNCKAFIPFEERLEIVSSIKFVDLAVPQDSMDKLKAWQQFKFNVMFVGSDWENTSRWNAYEAEFKAIGVDIIYFPYTKTTSSTKLRKIIDLRIDSK